MTVSEAESIVMEVLWRDHPLSAEEIIERLGKKQDWHPRTIKSLLNRLLKKRAIAAKKDGRRYLYRPRIDRAQYVSSRSADLLDQLFGGRVAPLVAHFSEQGKLRKKDIEELKRLLEEIENDRGGRE
jgi:predicted transcriptional regulator